MMAPGSHWEAIEDELASEWDGEGGLGLDDDYEPPDDAEERFHEEGRVGDGEAAEIERADFEDRELERDIRGIEPPEY